MDIYYRAANSIISSVLVSVKLIYLIQHMFINTVYDVYINYLLSQKIFHKIMLSPKNIIYLPHLNIQFQKESTSQLKKKRMIISDALSTQNFKKIIEIIIKVENLVEKQNCFDQSKEFILKLMSYIRQLKKIITQQEIQQPKQLKPNDLEFRNKISKLEANLSEKEKELKSLKNKTKILTNKFNIELSSILKKKILNESQQLNYDELFKIYNLPIDKKEIVTAHSKVSVDNFQEFEKRQKTQSSNQSGMEKIKTLGTNSEFFKSEKYTIQQFGKQLRLQQENKTKQILINELRKQIQVHIEQKGSLTKQLLDFEQIIKSKEQELAKSKNEMQIIREQLIENEKSESFLIKELNKRLEQIQQQVELQRNQTKHEIKKNRSSILQLDKGELEKKLLREEIQQKQSKYISQERLYIRKLMELQQEIQNLKREVSQ